MTGDHGRFVMVDEVRTHSLEAGRGSPLVLLHSGEFGGCAELSWERNLEALGRRVVEFAGLMALGRRQAA